MISHNGKKYDKICSLSVKKKIKSIYFVNINEEVVNIRPDGNGTTLIESFKCAFRGAYLPLSERNMRIHCIAAVLAIATGLLLKISSIEWCLIIIVIGNVISKEIQNSSIETSVDLYCSDHNPKARDSKDKAAGAVLIAAIIAVIIGIIIFIPKIMALYNI